MTLSSPTAAGLAAVKGDAEVVPSRDSKQSDFYSTATSTPPLSRTGSVLGANAPTAQDPVAFGSPIQTRQPQTDSQSQPSRPSPLNQGTSPAVRPLAFDEIKKSQEAQQHRILQIPPPNTALGPMTPGLPSSRTLQPASSRKQQGDVVPGSARGAFGATPRLMGFTPRSTIVIQRPTASGGGPVPQKIYMRRLDVEKAIQMSMKEAEEEEDEEEEEEDEEDEEGEEGAEYVEVVEGEDGELFVPVQDRGPSPEPPEGFVYDPSKYNLMLSPPPSAPVSRRETREDLAPSISAAQFYYLPLGLDLATVTSAPDVVTVDESRVASTPSLHQALHSLSFSLRKGTLLTTPSQPSFNRRTIATDLSRGPSLRPSQDNAPRTARDREKTPQNGTVTVQPSNAADSKNSAKNAGAKGKPSSSSKRRDGRNPLERLLIKPLEWIGENPLIAGVCIAVVVRVAKEGIGLFSSDGRKEAAATAGTRKP